MGDIDISKLSPEWQKYAKEADANNDGKLNLNANSVFEEGEGKRFKEIALAAGKSEEAINDFLLVEMGVDISSAIPQQREASLGEVKSINAKDSKEQMKYIIQQMNKNLANYTNTDGINWTNVTKDMKSGNFTRTSLTDEMKETSVDWNKVADDLIAGLQNIPWEKEQNTYNELSNIIKDMASIMSSFKYGSKDDIEITKQKIEKLKSSYIANNDEFGNFKSKILDNFIKIAEEHQKNREFQILKLEYKNLRSGVSVEENVLDSNGMPIERKAMTREEAVESIKKKYKGSYFSKGLISQLEKDVVMKEARDEVKNAMFDLRVKLNDDGTLQEGNYPTTASDVIKMAKSSGKITKDKYTDSILKGERSFTKKVKDKLDGKRVEIEGFSQYIAAYNRVEIAKTKEFTIEELMDLFDVKTSRALQPFLEKTIVVNSETGERKPLIIKLDNRKYSLTNLSDEIKKYASPTDLRVNYQTKALSEDSEFKNIKNAIRPQGTEIKDGTVNNLIDVMGFDRDKKDFGFYGRAAYKGVGLANVVDFFNNYGGAALSLLVANVTSTPATASVINNFKEVSEALRNQEILFNIDVDKSLHFEVNFDINTIIDGKVVDSKFTLDDWSVYRQLLDQGFTKDDFQLIKDSNGFRLIIDKKDIQSFQKLQKLADILGDNFDLEKDLGLKADPDLKQGEVKDNFKTAFLVNILTQMIINTIKECLRELPGEENFLQTTITAKTLEEYFNELDSKDKLKNLPNAKAGIMLLAQQCIKKDASGEPLKDTYGNTLLDNDSLQKLLEEIAGPKSFLNRFELINGMDIYTRENPIQIKAKNTPTPTPTPTPDPEIVVNPTPEPGVTVVTKPETVSDADTIEALHIKFEMQELEAIEHQWQDIVKVYPGLIEIGEKISKDYDLGKDGYTVAVRMLKVAQGIPFAPKKGEANDAINLRIEQEYSLDRLAELVKISFEDQSKLKNIEGYNYEAWYKFYKGTGRMVLPPKFAGIDLAFDKLTQTKAPPGETNMTVDAMHAATAERDDFYLAEGKIYNTKDDLDKAYPGKTVNIKESP